jgi:sulfate adenylyltransferase
MNDTSTELNAPYGGKLIDLFVNDQKKKDLTVLAATLQSVTLTSRAQCDLELLSIGAFSPLETFMNKTDYEGVLKNMRLGDGTLFPIPITLSVAKNFKPGEKIALRDQYANLLAIMTVEDSYTWSPKKYMEYIIGTDDKAHPIYNEIHGSDKYNISGKLEVISLPKRRDFLEYRMTPSEVRLTLEKLGNNSVVAFQTRNPLHRAHEELTKLAKADSNGTLLLHPVVGLTKEGDVDYITRVRCYITLVKNYYEDDTILSLLPLAMRMAGPREALWHAIIRKNYGASHFIVGRDHAGPGRNSFGNLFFGPYDAQELVKKHESEIGINILTYNEMVYVPSLDSYMQSDRVKDAETISISGTQVRDDYLARGRALPEWFTRPEVANILMESGKLTSHKGFCLWFTGLSGAGKTTISQATEVRLLEFGKTVTVLDGDVVRMNLSKGLGFNKDDRETNIARVGYVASEVVRHDGVAICALISPYEHSREAVRKLFEPKRFVEIYVSTPLVVCIQRDPKGHYAKTKHGKLKNFTGIDSEYEPPKSAEIVLDTVDTDVERSTNIIIKYLKDSGLLE